MVILMIIIPSTALSQIGPDDMAVNLEEAFSFTKYPTYPQYDSMMQHYAAVYPALCRLDTFGTSAEGRLLLALKISDNVQENEPEPRFLYTSTMHGDELIGYILSLRLIDFLLSSYGSNSEVKELLDNLQIWINPLSNPDATFAGGDHTVAGSVRAIGPDLNRNFPDVKTGEPDDTTGHPRENQLMMLFLRKHMFNMSANLHSGAEVVNYPWDHKVERHPDTEWFVLISREYADEARTVNSDYMDSFMDDSTGIIGITNGYDWYDITGGRQDYVTHYLHGREVTLELSNPKKVQSEQLDVYWTYNQWSLFNYMSQAAYGIHGTVTGSETGQPLQAAIRVQNHDDHSSWVVSDSAHGRFYRYLKEGIYDLAVSAEGFRTRVIEGVEVFDYQRTDLEVELDSTGAGLDPHPLLELQIYPNPARERVLIAYSDPMSGWTFDKTVRIITSDGRTVLPASVNVSLETIEMNISNLPAGIYFVGVAAGNRTSWMKIVKIED